MFKKYVSRVSHFDSYDEVPEKLVFHTVNEHVVTGEIIHLVASIRLSVCLSVTALTLKPFDLGPSCLV